MSYFTKTQVYRVDPLSPNTDAIKAAAAALKAGKLVAFPTETVYGLGANALDAEAIDRIYSAKQRPASDPIIAHIYDQTQLRILAVDIPDIAFELADAFFPGPLTLVLHRAPHVPSNIAAGLNTVAVRMPAHPVAAALIRAAGVPVAAPSANTFTRPSATTAAHVLEDLDGRVDIVLDGGATTIGLESTVLDLTGSIPVVLRPGGILVDALRQIIPNVTLAPRYLKQEDAASSSPGQLLKHYSPRAEMFVYSGAQAITLDAMQKAVEKLRAEGKQVGILCADEEQEAFEGATVISLGSRDELDTISKNLFAGMRALDSQQVAVILTRDYGRNGIGAALWDRLIRAAEGKVIEL